MRCAETYEWTEMYALEKLPECDNLPISKLKCAIKCFEEAFGEDQVLSTKIRGKHTDVLRTMLSFLFHDDSFRYSEKSAIQKLSSEYLEKISSSISKNSNLFFVKSDGKEILLPFFVSESLSEDECYMVVQKTWFYVFSCDIQRHYNRTFPIYPILARQHFFSFSLETADRFRLWHVMYSVLKWIDVGHRNRMGWMLDPLKREKRGWCMYQDVFTSLVAPYGRILPEDVLKDVKKRKMEGSKRVVVDPFSVLGYLHSVILMDAKHAIKFETLQTLKKWLEGNVDYKKLFNKTLETVNELLEHEHTLSFVMQKGDGGWVKMVEITDPISGKSISSKATAPHFRRLYEKLYKLRTSSEQVQILVELNQMDEPTRRNWSLVETMLGKVWDHYIPPIWDKFVELVNEWQRINRDTISSNNRDLFLSLLLPLKHWAMKEEDGKVAAVLCESFCIIDVDLVPPLVRDKKNTKRMSNVVKKAKDDVSFYENTAVVREGILGSFLNSLEDDFFCRMNNVTTSWLRALESYCDARSDEYWKYLGFWGEKNPNGEYVSFCINFEPENRSHFSRTKELQNDEEEYQNHTGGQEDSGRMIYDDVAFPLIRCHDVSIDERVDASLFFYEGLIMDIAGKMFGYSEKIFYPVTKINGEKKKRKLLDVGNFPSKRHKPEGFFSREPEKSEAFG